MTETLPVVTDPDTIDEWVRALFDAAPLRAWKPLDLCMAIKDAGGVFVPVRLVNAVLYDMRAESLVQCAGGRWRLT